MAVSSTRQSIITFTGDVNHNYTISAATNATSPGDEYLISLTAGNTTISPTSGLVPAPTSLTIIPPSGNTTLITIKGVNADTGIPIHKTDHTVLALDTSFTSIVMNASAPVNSIRIIWA